MIVSFDEVRRVAFRALDGGGAAPGIDDDCGWGCAWLEACGYPGLAMLVEAMEETPRERRRPSLEEDAIGLDLKNVSAIFSALSKASSTTMRRSTTNQMRRGAVRSEVARSACAASA